MSMVDAQNKKLNLGVDGLTHGHVVWVFKHKDTTTFNLVGIAEPNRNLLKKCPNSLVFQWILFIPLWKR